MSEQAPSVREALAVYATEVLETERVSPGYKQTEVGVIPEDWDTRQLRADIERLDTGVSVNSVDEKLRDYGHNQFILKTSAVANGKFMPSECKKIAPKDFSRARLNPRANTIIISRMNTPDLVGEIGYVDKDYSHLFLPDRLWMASFRKNSNVCARWLSYLLNSKEYKARIKDAATGTSGSMKNISKGSLLKIVIPFPSEQEQRAIAAALADVDALISALDKLIAKKRAVKTAAMQQLLTGKQRLPGFSGEWEMRRLGDVFCFLSTANNPRSDLSEHGEIRYIHYGDIHAMTSSFLDCSRAKMPHISGSKVKGISLLEEGDLVMADASEDYEGVGKSIEVKNLNESELVAGLHTFLLRGNKELLADGFKGYLQNVPRMRSALVRLATGTSVYGISKNNVRSIELALPSVEEQIAIATVLSDMDAEIEALEARREKTRQVKQGMMQELLTGRTRLV